jgi:predicted TIM-barrel fold metal-dependent hydrolase
MLVDVHAHHSPAAYTEAMARLAGAERPRGWDSLNLPHTDSAAHITRRLEMMDEAGVQMQVLSHGIMAPYVRVEADALEAARACNDGYADLVQRYPERFAALVSLPLPHVDAALRELQRGMDELGMIGAAMNCSVYERSTAESEFEPLYAELDRRGAVLFFHPCASGICSPMITDYGLSGAAGTSMEDTTIVLHLIVKDIPRRYPNIKIVIAHLGGLIPMLLQRLDHQLVQPGLVEPPSVTARRLYYDTVGHGSHAALLCAWKAFGASHLVPGSDWPVLLAHESYRQTMRWIADAGLPAEDVEQILERSGPALLPSVNAARGR